MIHPLADVQSTNIGLNTAVWQFSIILKGAKIGSNCNINCHCFIENEVEIGNNVTLKSGVYVWDGLKIQDDVFVGPNVTFVNDLYPRSKKFLDKHPETIVRKGASIGAGATVIAGIEIGEYALIGAGAVVTKSVPANALVVGNPAKVVGWVNNDGEKLNLMDGYYTDSQEVKYKLINNKLIKL